MPKIRKGEELTAPLSQGEAGRVITLLQDQGIRVMYRELVGFSPTDALTISSLKGTKIKAADLARMAGRYQKEKA